MPVSDILMVLFLKKLVIPGADLTQAKAQA